MTACAAPSRLPMLRPRAHRTLSELYDILAETYPEHHPQTGEAAIKANDHGAQAREYEKVRETLREWLTADTQGDDP